MTTPLNTILGYQSIDLTPFEIRGVKSGINNAYSTGPVYDGGQYFPATSTVTGNGLFASDSTVRNLTGITTYLLNANDNAIVNDTTYSITGILSTDSFGLNTNPWLTGSYPIIFHLGQREYIVEPDSENNTLRGYATFTRGSIIVDGTSTYWNTDLTSGDFIKDDYYQQYYKIDYVIDDLTLALVSTTPFQSDTTNTTYTAKRWAVGRTKIQYARNNITFDNRSGHWKYDATAGSDVTTSLSLSPLVDGIDLAFTNTIVQNAPDLMDVATTNPTLKTFARQTQYDAFQFSLPVVPDEKTMFLKINGVPKDRFPLGNQDYVLNYSQNPTYSPPPPPDQRQVANIMFLNGLKDTTIATSLTQTGNFLVTNQSGAVITDIMPGSEYLSIGGIDQTSYKNYMLEANTGTIETISSVINEPIVKYVASDYSQKVDPGFAVYLNGQKQKISYPAEADDDVIFQLDFGILRPKNQDHPGPNDIYQVNYMVEANVIYNELIKVPAGVTTFKSSVYPIKQGSTILQAGSIYLSENVDYAVSSLTGWLVLTTAPTSDVVMNLSYTPLSKQVNEMTYSDGTSYCSSIDTRLKVASTDFSFTLVNTQLDPADITITRIYNETRDADYNLTGLSTDNKVIKLSSSLNSAIGLGLQDIVLINYTFENETTEFFPVVPNLMNLNEGGTFFYFEGLNLTSQIVPGTMISVMVPDGASQYFFIIDSVSYDVVGTRVSLQSAIPADLTNPKIFVADNAINFSLVPSTASPFISGSTSLTFPNFHGVSLFRKGTLIKINTDIYQALSASYDTVTKTTNVTLSSKAVQDYTKSSTLSSIYYSDVPVYNVGNTEIVPRMPAITLVSQPAFILNNNGGQVLDVFSDASNLYIDGTAFSYLLNPYFSDMSSSIFTANIDSLTLLTYVPQWQSNKIIPGQKTSVYTDSNTVLYASDALRYKYDNVGNFVDSTAFSLTSSSTVLLTKPLEVYDRYNLDYMGRRYLYDAQVKYSLRYFVSLSAKSKVQASFEYKNLDQFYIQVLDRRLFFEDVTIPRMTNEAIQLNGNVGQGGQLSGDEGGSNTDGGISGDEYRRKDAEIECRVFKDIYDFFENRLEAFGTEMDAATGIKLFNNDGYFSNSEQLAAFAPVNRIFPFPEYTKMEPVKVNPLIGYFFDSNKVVFINGHTGVYSIGGKTKWREQFVDSSNFIGRTDTTRVYSIASVISDSSLSLSVPFQEHSSYSYRRGDKYTASTGYPLYDDDGYLGPKIIGTESENFGLTDGDVFDILLNKGHTDQTHCFYVFQDPPFPSSLYLPGVSELSAGNIAGMLSTNIPNLLVTAESVLDSSATFGYRTGLVLRTDGTINNMLTGLGSAVQKLGFDNSSYAYGNRDRTDHYPELVADSFEIADLTKERNNDLLPLLAVNNKLNRVLIPGNMALVTDLLGTLIPDSFWIIWLKEIPRITDQINSEAVILQEHLASYTQTQIAHTNALIADTSAFGIIAYDVRIFTNYEDTGVPWAWALDFTGQSQIVHGKNTSNVAVPVIGPGDTTIAGQTSFILWNPPDPLNDVRILNTGLLPSSCYPTVVYENNGQVVNGYWTGMDPSAANQYSLYNYATFYIDSTSPIILLNNASPDMTNVHYSTDTTSLNINWISPGNVYNSQSFIYGSQTVLDIKNDIVSVTSLDVTGNTLYDSDYAASFRITSGLISPDATIYRGFRDCTVAYQTISDRLLNNRDNTDSQRINYLTNRINYLNIREGQIKNHVITEQCLRTPEGGPSDLYVWANNRFNRRQGCYSRLNQIQQQIASNQSALSLNKGLMP